MFFLKQQQLTYISDTFYLSEALSEYLLENMDSWHIFIHFIGIDCSIFGDPFKVRQMLENLPYTQNILNIYHV